MMTNITLAIALHILGWILTIKHIQNLLSALVAKYVTAADMEELEASTRI